MILVKSESILKKSIDIEKMLLNSFELPEEDRKRLLKNIELKEEELQQMQKEEMA